MVKWLNDKLLPARCVYMFLRLL